MLVGFGWEKEMEIKVDSEESEWDDWKLGIGNWAQIKVVETHASGNSWVRWVESSPIGGTPCEDKLDCLAW